MKKRTARLAAAACLLASCLSPNLALAQQQQQAPEVVDMMCSEPIRRSDGNNWVYCVFWYSDDTMGGEWSKLQWA